MITIISKWLQLSINVGNLVFLLRSLMRQRIIKEGRILRRQCSDDDHRGYQTTRIIDLYLVVSVTHKP